MVVKAIRSEPHFRFITPSKFMRATPTLAVWGAATLSAVFLFGSDIPIVRHDVLSKIPLMGRFFPAKDAKPEEEE